MSEKEKKETLKQALNKVKHVRFQSHTPLSDHSCKNTCDDKLCSLLEETSGLKLCAEEYRVMLHPAL